MKNRYLSNEEKRACEGLWREAFFEDSDSFREYYFTEKVKTNQILVAKKDRQILSMIHRNPYQLNIKNQKVVCDYLVGVATKIENRGQGYMRSLLKQALLDMYQEDMPFCFLMPADRRIYEPFDFVYVFDQPVWELKSRTKSKDWLEQEVTDESAKEIADWMNEWLKARYEVFTWRDENYVKVLLKELKSENGSLKALKAPENPHQIKALRAEWGMEKKEQRLLYANADDCKKIKQEPAIMVRIVNLPEFLKYICLKDNVAEQEVIYQLKVKDKLLEKNDGIWIWHVNHKESFIEASDGKAFRKKESDEQQEKNSQKERTIELEISELTSWLLGYEIPENISETVKAEICYINRIFLDEIV